MYLINVCYLLLYYLDVSKLDIYGMHEQEVVLIYYLTLSVKLVEMVHYPIIYRQKRRKICCLTNMYIRSSMEKITVEVTPMYIQNPTCVTHSFHPKQFIKYTGSNIVTPHYKFFTRTVKEWNNLPEAILLTSTAV